MHGTSTQVAFPTATWRNDKKHKTQEFVSVKGMFEKYDKVDANNNLLWGQKCSISHKKIVTKYTLYLWKCILPMDSGMALMILQYF